MTKIVYKESAVAFIDVLGFKPLVNESVFNDLKKNQLQSLVDLLGSAISGLNTNVSALVPTGLIPKHIYISDSIILSAPIGNFTPKHCNGLEAVVLRTIQLIHILLDAGYLLRGGIAVGKVWHSDSNIVGPAYQEAYCIEQHVNFPCIKLSDMAATTWNSGCMSNSRMCVFDNNDLIVNGLHEWYVPDETHGGIERAYANYSEVINNQLNSDLEQKHKDKWEWFRDFLNKEKSATGR